jgi:hypothetical protein
MKFKIHLYIKIIILLIITVLNIKHCSGQIKTTGFMISLSGGTTSPINPDFSANYSTGYNFHISGGYVLNTGIAVNIALEYDRFGSKIIDDPNNNSLKLYSIKANGLIGNFCTCNQLHVFLYAGTALMFIQDGNIKAPDSGSKMGFDAGIGLYYKFGHYFALFGEVEYNLNLGKGYLKSFLPVRLGTLLIL